MPTRPFSSSSPRSRRRAHARTLFLATLFTPALALGQQTRSPRSNPSAPATRPTLEDAVAADIRSLSAALFDEASPQLKRDEAARRLLSRRPELCRKPLLAAIVDVSNRPAQLAVARALAAEPAPDPTFVTPLNALLGSDRQLTEAAAQALTNYISNTPTSVPDNRQDITTLLLQFAGSKDRPESCRLVVIRALGGTTASAGIPEKRVAALLVSLLNEPGPLASAAADALADLTADRRNAHDLARWNAWWLSMQDRPDAEFRQTLLTSRAALADSYQTRYTALTEETATLLTEAYRLLPDSEKSQRLLRLLQSPQPALRAAGARIIYGDALENRTVAPILRQALCQLVGSSYLEVRTAAVTALTALNDASALDALLTQLPQDPDPDARAMIAQALGPIRNTRAIPPLLTLLNDDYLRVAESAAEAIAAIGPELRREPSLANTATAALLSTLNTRATPANAALRAACVEALIPLRRRELLPLAQSILTSPLSSATTLPATRPDSPPESARTRRAALRFIAELHEPDAAPTVIEVLQDPANDPTVRLEAVSTLGAIPTFQHAETLYRRLDPATEPDAAIRQRAWLVLADLFPLATRAQLIAWNDRLALQPQRRLAVLSALANMLTAPGDDEQLALTRQQTGETLTLLSQPTDAVLPFRQALTYWRSRAPQSPIVATAPTTTRSATLPSTTPLNTSDPVVTAHVESLYRLTLDALLSAHLYPDAARFTTTALADLPSLQQPLAQRLRDEVNQLLQSDDLPSATQLFLALKSADPRLPASCFQGMDLLEPPSTQSTTAPADATSTPGTQPTTRPASR